MATTDRGSETGDRAAADGSARETESGIEILTYYSRDLESLIIPAD